MDKSEMKYPSLERIKELLSTDFCLQRWDTIPTGSRERNYSSESSKILIRTSAGIQSATISKRLGIKTIPKRNGKRFAIKSFLHGTNGDMPGIIIQNHGKMIECPLGTTAVPPVPGLPTPRRKRREVEKLNQSLQNHSPHRSIFFVLYFTDFPPHCTPPSTQHAATA